MDFSDPILIREKLTRIQHEREGDDGCVELRKLCGMIVKGRKKAKLDGKVVVLARASVEELEAVILNDIKRLESKLKPTSLDAYGKVEKRLRKVFRAGGGGVEGVLDPLKVESGGKGGGDGFVEVEGGLRIRWNGKIVDGVVFLRNFFTIEEQAQMIRRALRCWLCPPFPRNMDGKKWEDGWDLGGVTWATIGAVYDWTNRKYVTDASAHPPFPQSLHPIAQEIVRRGMEIDPTLGDLDHPDAGIVNLYNHKTAMGGHRDDAEETLLHPVLSISLGCSAIFLLSSAPDGGRSTPPIPIVLRSGDVLLFGGKKRLAVHGVPTILPHTAPSDLLRQFTPHSTPPSSSPLPSAASAAAGGAGGGGGGGGGGEEGGESVEGIASGVSLIQDAHLGMPRSSVEEDAIRLLLETHRINVNVRQARDRES